MQDGHVYHVVVVEDFVGDADRFLKHLPSKQRAQDLICLALCVLCECARVPVSLALSLFMHAHLVRLQTFWSRSATDCSCCSVALKLAEMWLDATLVSCSPKSGFRVGSGSSA